MVFADPNLFQTEESKLEEERRKRKEFYERLGLEQPSPIPAQQLLSEQLAPPTTNTQRFANSQSPSFSDPVEFSQGGPQRMSRTAPPVRQTERKEQGFGEKLLNAAANVLPTAAGALSEFFLPGSGALVKAAGETVGSAAKGEAEEIPGNLLKTGGKELLRRAGASKSPEEKVAESAAKKVEKVADEGLTKLADNLGPTTAEQNIARDRVRKLTTDMLYLDNDQAKKLSSELNPVEIQDYGAFKRASKYFESPGLARRAIKEGAMGESTAQNLAAMARASLQEYDQMKSGDLSAPLSPLDAGFGAGQMSPYLGRVDLSPETRIYLEELAALDPTKYRSSDFSPISPKFTSANVNLVDDPTVSRLAGPSAFLNEESIEGAISNAVSPSASLQDFVPSPAANSLLMMPTPSLNPPTASQFNAGELLMRDPQIQNMLAESRAASQMPQMGLNPVMQGPQVTEPFDFSPQVPLPSNAQGFLNAPISSDLGALNEAVFQATQNIPAQSSDFSAFSGQSPDFPPPQTIGAAQLTRSDFEQNLNESDMYGTMQSASNPTVNSSMPFERPMQMTDNAPALPGVAERMLQAAAIPAARSTSLEQIKEMLISQGLFPGSNEFNEALAKILR